MSGHSKWATTKRAKAVTDSKRSSLFTKLSKNITVAARDGVDPAMNFKLRIAIDQARNFNMPKDNVERAINKASGAGAGAILESLLYEAYGPDGIAILIEVVTDNRNRTVSNLKHILNKYDGSLAGTGSVMWMFDTRGQIVLDTKDLSDTDELDIIEAGAIDIIRDEQVKVITGINDLEKVKNIIQTKNIKISASELVYLAKTLVEPKDSEKLLKLLDTIDDDDDVNNIYTNANI
jgi:YebC/PmpR family DNA-binding regulatory protein